MRYHNVCLEALGYALPEEIVTSVEIEQRLAPLYRRLNLPEGRLELMTGIRARRFWRPGTLPSSMSTLSGARALEAAQMDREHVGGLVHGSVCRDFLEPATASSVHYQLGLPSDAMVYDVSNACLGMLDGVVQVANMIELGQIRAGLVVGTEAGRPLVETTIERLNGDLSLTRQQVKMFLASLTIGSASAAVLLCNAQLSRTGNLLHGATVRANTAFHRLCQSGRDEAVKQGMRPQMETDSERLMHEGIATGVEAYELFLKQVGWSRQSVNKSICHQVGVMHRRLLLDSLQLNSAFDFTTFEMLGNTGAVALPVTMALAAERGALEVDDRVALLGIGSGINTLMLAVDWRHSLVCGDVKSKICDTERLSVAESSR